MKIITYYVCGLLSTILYYLFFGDGPIASFMFYPFIFLTFIFLHWNLYEKQNNS